MCRGAYARDALLPLPWRSNEFQSTLVFPYRLKLSGRSSSELER
jgi:hypothetical protein